jgi:cytochrome P450
MTAPIDLYDPSVQEDWYPTYERLRSETPVYKVPGANLYVISRYDDVLYVLRHQELFPTGSTFVRSEAARAVYRDRGWERMNPLSVNPPDHRSYRSLVDGFFNGEGLAPTAPLIESTISSLIDDFVADGSVEFISQFATPLPVAIITHLLGFPAEDIDRLKAWSAAWVLPFSGPLSEEQEVWVAENVVEFQHYIAAHAQEKRRNPTDDVLSALVQARFDNTRPLTDHEVITITDHLYIGGNETTAFALASAMWILLRTPGLLDEIRNDRERVPTFIEEALRLESPTQGLFRVVADDVELHGVTIPKGAAVHIRYASANRDPEMFEDPKDVHLDRPNARRHMAFSLGEHSCPGSGLSRLEQTMAINSLLDRLEDLSLDETANDYHHHPGFVLRALRELHLRFKPSTPTRLV